MIATSAQVFADAVVLLGVFVFVVLAIEGVLALRKFRRKR